MTTRVAALFGVLTIVMAYPFSLHPATHVLSVGTDTDLFLWTLGWDVHALVTRPWAIFDANIFFPFTHTLAYSENLIGSAIFAAPIVWMTKNVILAMNLLSLVSVPLSALGAYLLARELEISTAGAITAGLVFGFAPPRFFRLDQFHLTTIQWIPFCLLYLHRYFRRREPRDLRIAIAFFTLQALTSGHGAAFLSVAIAMLFAFEMTRRRDLRIPFRALGAAGWGVLLLVPAALIFVPYRAAQTEVGLRRVLDVDWGVSASSFISSPSHVDLWLASWLPASLRQPPDAWLFPGVVPLLLASAAFLGLSREQWRRAYVLFYAAIGLVCLWLTMGPPIGLWQWVYWLPGFNFVRVPSRFVLLGLLGLAVLAGAGLDQWLARARPSKRQWIGALAAALLVAEFSAMPLGMEAYRISIPAIDQWLDTQPKPFSVVEVPVPDSLSVITQERRNTLYMLHSMGHWQPIVQGYSGIQPPGYMKVHWQLTKFPDEESLRTLSEMGVKYAVFHHNLVPASERDEVDARFERCRQWLTLEHVEGEGRVYSLHWR